MIGHMDNVACPLLGLHGSRVMGTWAIGHMRNGAQGQWDTWVMGHIAIIMYRSRWGTWVMGRMGNGTHSGYIQ